VLSAVARSFTLPALRTVKGRVRSTCWNGPDGVLSVRRFRQHDRHFGREPSRGGSWFKGEPLEKIGRERRFQSGTVRKSLVHTRTDEVDRSVDHAVIRLPEHERFRRIASVLVDRLGQRPQGGAPWVGEESLRSEVG